MSRHFQDSLFGRFFGGRGHASAAEGLIRSGRAGSRGSGRLDIHLPDARRFHQGPARGFTLIEILVVVVILGILAAIVVPRVMEHPGEARRVRAKQDIQGIVTALNMYRLDNFAYPSTEQGLEALVAKPSGTPDAPNWHQHLDKLPKDPWNRPYLYLRPGAHGDIDVFSYGADGKPGGEGEDADVGNWDL